MNVRQFFGEAEGLCAPKQNTVSQKRRINLKNSGSAGRFEDQKIEREEMHRADWRANGPHCGKNSLKKLQNKF